MSEIRCYLIPTLLVLLQMSPRTFTRQRKAGALPFLEELRPRIGRRPRYRADLVDRYLAGEWGRTAGAFGARRVR
jgi:hypothetical protein